MKELTKWLDMLDAHARALVRGNEEERQRVRALAASQGDLLALMDVAERVHAAYVPVQPRPAFRRELRDTLTRRSRRRLAWARWPRPLWRRYWVWGAVASVLSVAGGVGYLLLMRRSQAA